MKREESGRKSGANLATPIKRLPNVYKWDIEDSIKAAAEGAELIDQVIELEDNNHNQRLLHLVYKQLVIISAKLSNIKIDPEPNQLKNGSSTEKGE